MTKGKFLFCILAAVVQIALLIKCPLFILRQLSPHIFMPQTCQEASMSNESTTADQQYIFTMAVYSSLFIGRWLETLIIHIHIYKFLFVQETIKRDKFKDLCSKALRQKQNCHVITLLIILMIYMFIHSLSIPVLGMILELQSGQDVNCEDYFYEHHTVYWALDIIRYIHDVAIRILMILATIVIGELWSSNLPKRSEEENESESRNASEPESYDINTYLNDRKETNEDHETQTKKYAEIGGQVERILEIFQTWFPIPWLLYFTSTSLDTDHILKAWKDGSSGEGHYDFSEIAYMVYNFNQLSLLTIAFLCSKRMNTYHHKYFAKSRRDQITKFKTASRMAMASMNKIEKDEHFDFIPRVWGTSIKVPVESSIYIVTMLVGIFFTVCEALI